MKRVSREDVLELAVELAAQYGESLTLTAFRRETGLSQWAIFDLFGNWKNLRVELGLTPEAPRCRNKVTKAHILKLMREQAAQHGEKLTERMFLKATGLSGRLVGDRFGSWGELRVAVGLERRAKIQKRYSDEELLADLYRVYRCFRERPVYQKHRIRGGKISAITLRDRFGSWDWACRRLQDCLVAHGVYNELIPLPEELERKFREGRLLEE